MYLQLVREGYGKTSTEGKLFINGTFECYTLEDKDRALENGGIKVQNETAIPKGKYTINITMSPRFKMRLPLLLDVPQFTGVRIHKGNTSKNTEGCVLVGATNGSNTDDFIGNSKDAFDKLIVKLEAAWQANEDITLEIV